MVITIEPFVSTGTGDAEILSTALRSVKTKDNYILSGNCCYVHTRPGDDKNYSLDGFLNFLSSQSLIALGIDGYSIGVIGKEYLSFLIRMGIELS